MPFSRRVLALVSSSCLAAALAAGAATPKFYPDDPLPREPETQDASGVQSWDIDLFYDLAYNLFVEAQRPATNVHAANINTIDEVPDSSWFTNRIGTRPISIEEAVQGPVQGPVPDASAWTIIREKSAGAAPGFTMTDAAGQTYFLSFDSPANPDGATAAVVIATKIFWALGYNQVEYFLTNVRPDVVSVAGSATRPRPSGRRTPLTRSDLQEVIERAHRRADGSFRAAAGRLIPGTVVGGFKYAGTRPDDPNDVVPHEHRRELRALRVFGAWTNLTDMKAGNTLDSLVQENGRTVVRHYLQDVGSTFGVGANGPHDWNEGWEYLFEQSPSLRRLWSFGFALSPWQTAPMERHAAIGRFEGTAFDPLTWKPRVPTRAFLEMQDDDGFWAARRVMAFSDEMIRAIVKTGEFHDGAAERYLGDVLIARRDAIGRAYLTRVTPIVDPRLDTAGTLSFGNAAVDHRVAEPPTAYTAVWSRFDNATGAAERLGESRAATPSLQAPAALAIEPGGFIEVAIAAEHPAYPGWRTPVTTHFRRTAGGWTLVGLERSIPR